MGNVTGDPVATAETVHDRMRAVEQAIKLHGANGSTCNAVLADAARLMKWINGRDDVAS